MPRRIRLLRASRHPYPTAGRGRQRLLPSLLGGLAAALIAACAGERPSNPTASRPVPTESKASAAGAEAATAQAAGAPGTSASGAALLPGVETFGVVVGVLTFRDPKLLSFSPESRKDQELHELLVRRGVPASQLSLLLDGQATVEAIRAAIRTQAAAAPAGSTFLFYYAGHGSRDGDGAPYFIGYDTTGSSSGLSPAVVSELLGASFRGRRVVLMADSCYSGALQAVGERLRADRGIEAFVVTSAEASNRSTVNWTFTQAVIDSLGGDPLADRNADGRITVAELGDEVGAAMKFREHQRHGLALGGVDPGAMVAPASRRLERTEFGGFSVGDYVWVVDDDGKRVARIRQIGPADAFVRFFHYSQIEDRPVPVSSLERIEFQRHAAGTSLQVFWGSRLWDAKVLRVEGDFHFITYPGWESSWDEWVLSDRMVGAEGSPAAATASPSAGGPVEVEWHGRWYPARVLRRLGERTLIHYDGYDSSWDEWVGPARIRPRSR